MDRAIFFFPGGKTKAFTLSYDDGMDFDLKLIEICRAHGVKCTFNLNSGRMGIPTPGGRNGQPSAHRYLGPTGLREIYTPDVAEVATHGKLHAFLTQLPPHAVALEMLDDRRALEKEMGTVIRGHAYPFGAINDQTLEVMRQTGISYARTITSTYNFNLPENWLTWNPTCHHGDERLMELADTFLNRPSFGASLFYVWGHSYEFGFPNDWSIMEKLQDTVAGKDNVWYATNIEIHDYVEAYRSLQWSADCTMAYNPSSQDVWVATAQWPQRGADPVCIKPGETAFFK